MESCLIDFELNASSRLSRHPPRPKSGRPLQTHLAGSGHYVDALVEMVAEERLLKEEDDENRKPN